MSEPAAAGGPTGASQPFQGRVRLMTSAVRIEVCRSGGPGGQHVNTTDSADLLRCPLWALIGLSPAQADRLRALAGSRLTGDDEILLRCEEERSQLRNRELAWERLRQLVAQALPAPRRRRRTRPTRGSIERRLQGKRQQAGKKARRQNPPDSEA